MAGNHVSLLLIMSWSNGQKSRAMPMNDPISRAVSSSQKSQKRVLKVVSCCLVFGGSWDVGNIISITQNWACDPTKAPPECT